MVVTGLSEDSEVVVYNLAGQIVGSYVASYDRLEISLETGMVYIVRVGDKAARVIL